MDMNDNMWDEMAKDFEAKRQRDRIKKWWIRRASDLTITPALNEQRQFQDNTVYTIDLRERFKYTGTVKGKSAANQKQWSEGDFVKGKLTTHQDGTEFHGSFLPGMKKGNGRYRSFEQIGGVMTELVFEIKLQNDRALFAQGVREVYQYQGDAKKGTLISRYEGRLKNGIADGIGMYKTFGAISLIYEGEFLNNQFDGLGKLVTFGFSNKTEDQCVMEGTFQNGQLVKGTTSILKYYLARGGFDSQYKIMASEEIGFSVVPVVKQQVKENPEKVSIIQKEERLADYQTSKIRQSRLQDESAPHTPSTKGLVTDQSPYSNRQAKMSKTAKESNNPFSRAPLNIKKHEDPNVPKYEELYL